MTKEDFINVCPEDYEYPRLEALLHMENNVSYEYICSSFLNGIVNMLDNLTAYSVCRYSVDDHIDMAGCTLSMVKENPDDERLKAYFDNLKEVENIPDNKWYHTKLRQFLIDDVIITGETDESYYMLWFDNDVSDCNIEKQSKHTFDSLDNFNEYVEWKMETLGNYMQKIRQPKGWVSF